MLAKARTWLADLLSWASWFSWDWGRTAGDAAPPIQGVAILQAGAGGSPNEIFTPTRPRAGRRGLVGRKAELTRILEALNDEAAHVVVYAERGRGKTSLTNIAVERLRRSGTVVGRYACNADSTFDQIMRGLMRDLPPSLLTLEMHRPEVLSGKGCESILPREDLQPGDIADISSRLACNRLVLVVDEFDRVKDRATRTRLADTIKHLSDRGVKLLFMIVGVSSTLEQIIGEHPSIQRNITALHLPLMQDTEIEELLIRGGEAAQISFTDEACSAVSFVARGMPYMAQLMGLRIVQQTLRRGDTDTSRDDVLCAVERLLADTPGEVVGRYTSLTADPGGKAIAASLRVLAKSPQDPWGRLTGIHNGGRRSADNARRTACLSKRRACWA